MPCACSPIPPKVWNLDEQGVELSPGRMEVSPTDLVLHQRGRAPVRWPLRGLRRYGFDAQLFSFESGRRCPTGSGIYAFRCNRAEGLFNALQASWAGPPSSMLGGARAHYYLAYAEKKLEGKVHRKLCALERPPAGVLSGIRSSRWSPNPVQARSAFLAPVELPGHIVQSPEPRARKHGESCNSVASFVDCLGSCSSSGSDDDGCIQNSGAASAMTTTISSLTPGDTSQPGNGANGVAVQCDAGFTMPSSATLSCPTVDSSGYLEPIALGPPRPPTMPSNPATQQTTTAPMSQHSYVNSCAQCGLPHPPPCVDANTNYAKLDELLRQEVRQRDSHFYVNVNPAQAHSYANLSCPASPDRAASANDEVNYVVLDLDHQSDSSAGAMSPVAVTAPGSIPPMQGGTASQPTSPLRAPEGYATIDFDRTAALSNSANPGAHQHDDSVRKTRHNSTAVPVLC
ncbi:unnamed protein product [Ixodes hexagonus]